MESDEQTDVDILDRIVVDPSILVGKPVIKGTRIPVSRILNLVGHGASFADIVEDYPGVTIDDIRASLLYAEVRLERKDVFPLVTGP